MPPSVLHTTATRPPRTSAIATRQSSSDCRNDIRSHGLARTLHSTHHGLGIRSSVTDNNHTVHA